AAVGAPPAPTARPCSAATGAARRRLPSVPRRRAAPTEPPCAARTAPALSSASAWRGAVPAASSSQSAPGGSSATRRARRGEAWRFDSTHFYGRLVRSSGVEQRGSFMVGEVGVDLDARLIRRGRRVVVVEPRVFDLLAYLLAHRDR